MENVLMADGWFWRGVGDIYDEGSNEFITVEGNGIAIGMDGFLA